MLSPDIAYLTNIYFRYGAVDLVPQLLAELGSKRCLLVTDRGVTDAGLLDTCRIPNVATYDEGQTNPSEKDVENCLAIYTANACDSIVAIGGGSPIDLAKAVALASSHPEPLDHYSVQNNGAAKIRPVLPPVIAVPTTAGTGAEVGRAALITLGNGTKRAILSSHLIPKGAVCDPLLTISMPPLLTAATGMDAISHCVETFLSPRDNPVAEAIALDGLARGTANIERAQQNGDDRAVRREMMLCALQGALAFQKGLGAVHSLSHPLGAVPNKRLHHGTLNAIFLPHVLRFNFERTKEKLTHIARVIGAKSAAGVPDWFAALSERLKLPSRLRDLGVTEADLQPLAQHALTDHCSATNPTPLTEADLQRLYREAY